MLPCEHCGLNRMMDSFPCVQCYRKAWLFSSLHLHCDRWMLVSIDVITSTSTSATGFVLHKNLTCNSLRFMTCRSDCFPFPPSPSLLMSELSFGVAVRPTLPHHHVCRTYSNAKWTPRKKDWRHSLECVQTSKVKIERWMGRESILIARIRAYEYVSVRESVFDVKLLWCVVSSGPLNVLLAFKLCYCYYCCCYECDKYVIT